MQRVLVTGAAGFIGYHVSERLLSMGCRVVGIDNLNDYYDPALKEGRLARLRPHEGFTFERLDVANGEGLNALFAREGFDGVVHLAAQAGVRYSIQNPGAYVQSNLVGFGNILESCRHHKAKHLVFASSSSVYGANTRVPFSVSDNVDHPMSFYAATKKANELMAHSYANLYKLPVSGLRFFTVYGPWGRPDMALFLFAQAILAGRPIDVFNHGKMRRDFTYIDDIVEGVVRVLDKPATPDPTWSSDQPDPSRSFAPYRIYNIGNNQPVELMEMISQLEKALGKEAQKRFLELQPGDVPATYADIEALASAVDFRPRTTIQEGVAKFVAWYREYHKLPALTLAPHPAPLPRSPAPIPGTGQHNGSRSRGRAGMHEAHPWHARNRVLAQVGCASTATPTTTRLTTPTVTSMTTTMLTMTMGTRTATPRGPRTTTGR